MNDFIRKSYLAQRKAIGILGFLLPFFLVLGSWTNGVVPIGPSLSKYYYSFSRDIFVGTLVAIGVFLLYYTGHQEEDKRDKRITTIAGVLMIFVAAFPCIPGKINFDAIPCFSERTNDLFQFIPAGAKGWIHNLSAIGTFGLLGAMSFFQFTKYGSKDTEYSKENMPTEMKKIKQRMNRLYRICGVVIWSLLLLMIIFHITRIPGVFWLESLMLWAFAISWFIKGLDYKRKWAKAS